MNQSFFIHTAKTLTKGWFESSLYTRYCVGFVHELLSQCNDNPINIAVLTAIGPGHAKTCLTPYSNNKGADQSAHLRSLISTFVVRCLDSMICMLVISKVSGL